MEINIAVLLGIVVIVAVIAAAASYFYVSYRDGKELKKATRVRDALVSRFGKEIRRDIESHEQRESETYPESGVTEIEDTLYDNDAEERDGVLNIGDRDAADTTDATDRTDDVNDDDEREDFETENDAGA